VQLSVCTTSVMMPVQYVPKEVMHETAHGFSTASIRSTTHTHTRLQSSPCTHQQQLQTWTFIQTNRQLNPNWQWGRAFLSSFCSCFWMYQCVNLMFHMLYPWTHVLQFNARSNQMHEAHESKWSQFKIISIVTFSYIVIYSKVSYTYLYNLNCKVCIMVVFKKNLITVKQYIFKI